MDVDPINTNILHTLIYTICIFLTQPHLLLCINPSLAGPLTERNHHKPTSEWILFGWLIIFTTTMKHQLVSVSQAQQQ